MTSKPSKRIPLAIALGVIAFVGFCRWSGVDLFERFELVTFDMRVRQALHHPVRHATNLAFVFIDEATIGGVRDGSLGYKYGLYWPRQVYGRAVKELADQGAEAIGLDVLLAGLRPDHPLVQMQDGSYLESDEFFAMESRLAGNLVLATTRDLSPPSLFLTNALRAADISTDRDADGVLRRAYPFRLYRDWHPAFRSVEADPSYAVDLRRARLEPRQVVLVRQGLEDIRIPLDQDGTFDLEDFWGASLPPGVPRRAKPFTEKRVWLMGIVLAALELGLDLDQASVDLERGRIRLTGKGQEREIPIDRQGRFYIDWSLPPNHPDLAQAPLLTVLQQEHDRLEGKSVTNAWQGKLVVVGSSALANDLTDRGATPLQPDTLLVSKHWNVANSVLTGRFVRRSSLLVDLALIGAFGAVAAAVTWRARGWVAFTVVVLGSCAYVAAATQIYSASRLWLPLVLPVAGGMLGTHLTLVTWRVVFEQSERRRVRSLFSKMVSPKVVNELLAAETLSLGGTQREISVFFADVRGFTAWTDREAAETAESLRRQGLTGTAAVARVDENARDTLETVNVYLGLIATLVKEHDGTFDKFIGDCVMAFWGAPVENPRHALDCVRTAIEVQRAIERLNQQRANENARREAENPTRIAGGQAPLRRLPILRMGSGINTGFATAGLMGSTAAESLNYTVFGREVNLASRLESASGESRILISRTTYEHLTRDDPALAGKCVELAALHLKGFQSEVRVYEVPWREEPQ